MFRGKVKSAPLWAWIAGAVSAPLALTAGKNDWIVVAAVSILCGAVSWTICRLADWDACGNKVYCIIQCLWLGIISGEIGRLAKDSWPVGNMTLAVPLVLMVLAVFSAWDGAERASRTGSVLFWFLAILYAIILCAGAGNLKAGYLRPQWRLTDLRFVVVLLLPSVAAFIPRERTGGWAVVGAIAVLAVVLNIWTVGTLSAEVALSFENPFYEFSRSLSLFGVAERFEAFVSFALTLGSFGALSLILSASGQLGTLAVHKGGRGAVLGTAAVGAAYMLFCPQIPAYLLAVLSVLLWCVLPLILTRKNSKKSENKT